MAQQRIIDTLAEELAARTDQVSAAVELLDGGATVPFIARYRKEVTGGLDDSQLRQLEERLTYLRELEERRATILATIDEQGQLTDALRAAIEAATTKTRLEDLYRPYMRKKKTKAQMARAAGLEPLAATLLEGPDATPEALAAAYIDAEAGYPDAAAVLEGARHIHAEDWADDADLAEGIREALWEQGELVASVAPDQENSDEAAKFRDYFDYSERLNRVPSHRVLALFRGRQAGVLRLAVVHPDDRDAERGAPSFGESRIAARAGLGALSGPCVDWLRDTARWTWRVKLGSRLEMDLFKRIREAAEEEAIRVFATNLRALLLAAPAGARATLGLDPGLRTGVKVAAVDATGALAATETIYPHAPKKRWNEALDTLAGLVEAHGIELVAVGNGTASRETEQLAGELARRCPGLTHVTVSEAGASVYSASELASREFPDLDVALRGAVSIARRLQDPLAELVKIEPGHIGVGQYQHDVSQNRLSRSLEAVVEDCVNAVGVDVNTASPALLARVAGLGPGLAENIARHRAEQGPFRSRKDLMAVSRLGAVAFEQAAGFLRVPGGDNPLDASAVHPEAYPVVERIVERLQRPVEQIIGQGDVLGGLKAADFTDERFGEPTVADILAELEKPGRDPRGDFRTARFREDVTEPAHLKPNMALEGVVTNVTDFGAFVDVGVHQDGLVHISKLADHFVKDPHQVVKVGDVVDVHVIEVDLRRQRIALSMRGPETADADGGAADPEAARGNGPAGRGKRGGGKGRRDKRAGEGKKPAEEKAPQTAMAAAFAALKDK